MNSDPANGFRVDLIVFGTMHRTGEGAGLREVVEVGLFDASERRIVSRFEETHTVEELMDVSSRSELGRRWVRRLALGLGSDDAPLPPDHAPLEMAGWSLVGFAGASAIAAMVTGGLTLSMNGDARFNAYRSSWDAMSVSNVCDVAANDLSAEGRYAAGRCSDASTYEILTPVFWTVAALAGAAGVVLVWHPWTSSSYEVSVSLLPFLGRDRGGGSLTINF